VGYTKRRVSGHSAQPDAATPEAGPPTLAKRLDDVVYSVERALVVASLTLMVGLVSVDVLHRRLTSQESKVGRILRGILSIFWEPSERATRTIDGPVSWAVIFLGLWGLSVFGIRTLRGVDRLAPAKEWALGALVTAVVAGLGGLVLVVPSGVHLAILTALGAGAYVVVRLRAADERSRRDAAVGAIVGLAGAGAFVALVPEGFSWSKEASMILLVWNGFLGASMCSHDGRHVEFDFGPKGLPEKLRPIFLGAGSIGLVCFLFAMAYIGAIYAFAPGTGLYARDGRFEMTNIPDWIVGASIPFVFGLMGLRAVGAALRRLRAQGPSAWKPVLLAAAGALAVLGTFWLSGKLSAGETAGGWGWLALGLLLAVLLFIGEPLYMILGAATVSCFFLWEEGYGSLADLTGMAERIRGLADTQALLAIPFFMLSGNIMSSGKISQKIIAFARAAVGWLPGGLAIAGVFGCVIFAAISGSSPATLAAMGPAIAPALIARGYSEKFGIGLVTSAGSLGILIPPSIPMIIYCIFHTASPIEVERLFLAGFGPGFLIAGVLGIYSAVVATKAKIPLNPFSFGELGASFRDGFWALGLPGLILGGIYLGIFNAIEAAAVSCVYAVVVEIYFHRGLRWRDLPKVFAETSVLLGSFVIIVVMAMSLAEFLEVTGVPTRATEWIASMDLPAWKFLIALNLLLLVVGCLVDIMSAIMILVPIIAPMAIALGIDPIHLAIVFIVNLEIGYLTPPVGLNLFLGGAMFRKSFGYMIKASFPFVVVMTVGLVIITYVPAITLAPVRWVYGAEDEDAEEGTPASDRSTTSTADAGPSKAAGGKLLTMEEMMRMAEEPAADAGPDASPSP